MIMFRMDKKGVNPKNIIALLEARFSSCNCVSPVIKSERKLAKSISELITNSMDNECEEIEELVIDECAIEKWIEEFEELTTFDYGKSSDEEISIVRKGANGNGMHFLYIKFLNCVRGK